MKIVLIRHLAPLIEPGICYGRLDVAQDPAREDKAGALVTHPGLAGATHVWTSPAKRCRALAVSIAQTLTATITVDPRLRELDFGEWEGKPWDAVAPVELDAWAASPLTFAPPGGESGAALVLRVREFWAGLARDQRDCVIVSHGGPLKVLAALLDGRPVDLFAAAPPLGSVRIVTATVE